MKKRDVGLVVPQLLDLVAMAVVDAANTAVASSLYFVAEAYAVDVCTWPAGVAKGTHLSFEKTAPMAKLQNTAVAGFEPWQIAAAAAAAAVGEQDKKTQMIDSQIVELELMGLDVVPEKTEGAVAMGLVVVVAAAADNVHLTLVAVAAVAVAVAVAAAAEYEYSCWGLAATNP